MLLPWYIPLIKALFMSISNYYTVIKITNKKIENKLLLIALCLSSGIIYVAIRQKTNILIAWPIYYFIFSILYSAFSNTNIRNG